MRIPRTFALFAILYAVLWLSASNSYAATALKLRMRHIGVGPCDVYISSRALRLFSLNDKYQMIARAPYWKVTTFNPTSKMASELSLKQWRTYISQLSDGWAIVSMPDSHQESVEIAGLAARRVSTTIKGRKLGWPASFDARPFLREDAYYYSGTDVPFEAAMLVNALFDQDSAPELVLGLALVQPNGKSRKQVWTDSCETVDLPPKFFEPPQGMKEVGLAVVFGNVTVKQSDIKDMIDGVGIGKDLGSPKH